VESAELIAVLRQVREQVRARHPEAASAGIPLLDLMPLVHARDSALGKVAAIGSVNPRRGGLLNSLVQAWKRLVARALDWHVREQVEFNRKTVACMDATIEALTENNRSLSEIAGRLGALAGVRRDLDETRLDVSEFRREVDEVHTEVHEMRTDVAAVRRDLDGVGGTLLDMRADAGEMRSNIDGIRRDADELYRGAGEMRSDVAEMRSNVDEMRANVDGIRRDADGVSRNVGELRGYVDEMHRNVEEIHRNVGEIHGNVGEMHRNVDAMRRDVDEMGGSVGEMRGNVGEMRSNVDEMRSNVDGIRRDANDVCRHWSEWRPGWERKLFDQEVQFLRALADLQAASQFRADLIEGRFQDVVHAQHTDFTAALDRSSLDIQKRLWADLERIRLEYERLIFSELRTIRQRTQVTAASRAPATAPAPVELPPRGLPAPPAFDYGRFAERFRGSEDYVKRGQRIYQPYFAGCRNVLDIGCGRGEFLETMREAGVPARGIDLDEECVATCRHKGLEAEPADLYAYLADLPEASLDGIFCSQVVEHLAPERLPEMVRLCASRLARNGVIAIETPDPGCLAIFATHFYLDPTHTRPVPHALLAFYLEEFGVGNIEVHRQSPAVESFPSLASLPEDFRDAFFGGLDYAIVGRRL
jgi:O-antigen chain-terminating methyltransferase